MKPDVETVKLSVIRGRIRTMSKQTITEFLEARIAEDEDELSRTFPEWAKTDFSYGGTDDYHQFTIGYGRALAECAAKRELVTLVGGWGHEYNDDDTWYSCGLATGRYDDEPGSGCADDSKHDRCTCGLEARRLKILGPIAAIYKDHPDYRQDWAL